jgi:hypothetical protein
LELMVISELGGIKKSMKRIIFILLIMSNFSLAQTHQSGLILPDLSKVDEREICCIYTPKEGFSVFESPNGQKVGKLSRQLDGQKNDQEHYKLYFTPLSSQNPKQIEISNFQEIGYEVFAIPYFERKEGFVRVLNHTRNFWLNEDEIEIKGFKIENWQNFLFSMVGDLLGFYASDPGLNLRKEPNQHSELIATLKGHLFEISPLDQHEGSWTKVKVKKYKEHPCESSLTQDEMIEIEWEGWIKIIDDNDSPKVWYYSRGC